MLEINIIRHENSYKIKYNYRKERSINSVHFSFGRLGSAANDTIMCLHILVLKNVILQPRYFMQEWPASYAFIASNNHYQK